jgi:hypothetical protein
MLAGVLACMVTGKKIYPKIKFASWNIMSSAAIKSLYAVNVTYCGYCNRAFEGIDWIQLNFTKNLLNESLF